MAKILIVATSHAALGDTGHQTGLWLEELATPYYALRDGGAEVTIASVKGGKVPIDPRSTETDEKSPPSVRRFLADTQVMKAVNETPSIAEVDASRFDAIFLPGGHGTMWDLPGSTALASALAKAFDQGRVIAAVCHGPAGLVSVKDKNGQPIVRGKRVSSFTDSEEEAVGLSKVVPFLLESRLRELGARFEKTGNFQPFAVRDGHLITGQNPASSKKVAELLLEAAASAKASS